MARTAGSLRKVTLDGVSFAVPGDVNITINLSPFETEGLPSSGATMFKMTLRNPTAEGVSLSCEPLEHDQLKVLAKRLDNFPIALTLADNSTLFATGRINYESWETETNIATIIIIPDQSLEAWELFAAS